MRLPSTLAMIDVRDLSLRRLSAPCWSSAPQGLLPTCGLIFFLRAFRSRTRLEPKTSESISRRLSYGVGDPSSASDHQKNRSRRRGRSPKGLPTRPVHPGVFRASMSGCPAPSRQAHRVSGEFRWICVLRDFPKKDVSDHSCALPLVNYFEGGMLSQDA